MTESILTTDSVAQDLSEIYTASGLQSMEHLVLVTFACEEADVGDLGIHASDLREEVCKAMRWSAPTKSITGPIGNLYQVTAPKYWDTLEQPTLQDIVDMADLIGHTIFQTGTDRAVKVNWSTVKKICQGQGDIVSRKWQVDAGILEDDPDAPLADLDIMAFFPDVLQARDREKANKVKYRNAKGNQDQTAEVTGAIMAAGYGEHLDADSIAKADSARNAAKVTADPDHSVLVALDIINNVHSGDLEVAKLPYVIEALDRICANHQNYRQSLGMTLVAGVADPVPAEEPVGSAV
jgi:hypothetical protein